ncbi:MAG: hypothetical protein COT67_00895 [Candidatus Tagabacteria bacterium CG09_land_8_20_14_0_10_41_14]|uniref:Uncharacterized protein n=2 Tax=Candidatus Tagaibacteriota TaxID=1817918 RepID=A0A2H0WLS3_9BACT|nr:MAG: hypothetical protein COT67_00895 [Candidatus Tagabacteria bacterium CG09_land_8_20_14_0_10_41_14]PJE72917.1 MAG: hypothetical protein COV00_02685 [Candidatus Tagabacteria bacterium CG10_big_fil_rev_8_21_14_0_10_40_13]
MEKILVKEKEKTADARIFGVTIEGNEYIVTVPKEYWQKLTKAREEPESLVRRSFEFLLEREPKESILREFELSVIQKYFPEYETIISGGNF